MARYKTKVRISHGGRLFPVGAILPDSISKADIKFLKSKKFIEVYATEENEEDSSFEGLDEEDEFHEFNQGSLKTVEEIEKLRSKKAVKEYADNIGYELGADFEERTLRELQEEIILFQEESADEE